MSTGTTSLKLALIQSNPSTSSVKHCPSSEKPSTRASFKPVFLLLILLVKKLKSLDVPDLIKTVKAKKLPKEALRGVLGRFKLNG
jgi:hypothetical protein